jgi:hypothetical protein
MGPRYFQNLIHQRPTVGGSGDLVSGATTLISGAVWHRRRKAVVGGQGELVDITAIGFIPAGTDIQTRDELTVSGTTLRFEVVHVISGYNDRGDIDHVGIELRDI